MVLIKEGRPDAEHSIVSFFIIEGVTPLVDERQLLPQARVIRDRFPGERCVHVLRQNAGQLFGKKESSYRFTDCG